MLKEANKQTHFIHDCATCSLSKSAYPADSVMKYTL